MDLHIEPNGFILGFDPGGRGKFGWSICRVSNGLLQNPLKTGLADDACDALCQVKRALERHESPGNLPVLAAGIDAPMFWSPRGSRTVDDVLRCALTEKGLRTASVLQVNSLRGACLVQGMLIGRYLHETWGLKITEAHPKALKCLLYKHSKKREEVEMVKCATEGLTNDHKRDATLAAVAAWAMIHDSPGWQNLYNLERHPIQPFNTPISYWMPIPNTGLHQSPDKSCS